MKSSSFNEEIPGMSANEIFGRFTHMQEYVCIYVPVNSGAVDSEIFANATQNEMAKIFGGSSVHHVEGSYLTESGSLASENTYVVKSFATKITGVIAEKIIEIASNLKQSLGKDYIAVEYNGKMFFV
ncbi:hypothetical protein [Paenibacillus chitinolyticus]|uniref:hypothetical protein n=1 Tax=Paenibacillus chitinolyticus TaxID=79263 RepID=UPI003D02365D